MTDHDPGWRVINAGYTSQCAVCREGDRPVVALPLSTLETISAVWLCLDCASGAVNCLTRDVPSVDVNTLLDAAQSAQQQLLDAIEDYMSATKQDTSPITGAAARSHADAERTLRAVIKSIGGDIL